MILEKRLKALREMDLSRFSNSGHFKLGFRSEFLDTPILMGRERILILPNYETRRAVFCIVDLQNIIASHNEKTFASTDGYPTTADGRNINSRNYATDKDAKAKVIKVAQQLEPNILISTTATEDSTPIISLDGVVVSGNNRTMSLKLAVSENISKYLDYKDVLYNELRHGGYGFNNEIPGKIKNNQKISIGKSNDPNAREIKFTNPVLVRIDLDFPSYITEEMDKFNVDTKKSERQIDKAIRIAQQLEDNEQCKTQLIELISALDIVSELYKTASLVERFKKILLSCNLINENELAKFFQGNSLSENGKTMYEVILSSLILKPTTLEISQNPGVISATNKIVNAVIPAIKNQNFKVGSLNPDINNALLLQNRMVNSEIKDIAQYVNQPELFGVVEELDLRSATINYYINQSSRNEFKKVLLAYNDSMDKNQERGMFGDSLTPEYIFEATFINGLPKSVQGVFNKRFEDEGEKEPNLSPEMLRTLLKTHETIQKVSPTQENLDLLNSIKILLDE